MRAECLNKNPDCKYYPDCYSDEHHAKERCACQTHLEWLWSDLPTHKLQVCREQHELDPQPPLFETPPPVDMALEVAQHRYPGDHKGMLRETGRLLDRFFRELARKENSMTVLGNLGLSNFEDQAGGA